MPFRLIVLLERQIETLNSWFLPSKLWINPQWGKNQMGTART